MRIPDRMVTIVLAAGLAVSLATLVASASKWRLPGDQTGYEPVQPIAYSHRLHAGELQIDCLYCHYSAETSRHAGIPPVAVCLNCHQTVTASPGAVQAEEERAKAEGREPQPVVSHELAKLYTAMGLDAQGQDDPEAEPSPVAWTRVHRLPDYVYFNHAAHVGAGVRCQQCHGAVESMERVRQVESLSMGWCVNCHRDAREAVSLPHPVDASTDCATCHY